MKELRVMYQHISRETFEKALTELGQDPSQYRGQRLHLEGFCELYTIEEAEAIDAIENGMIQAHYDYKKDCIWIDALEAAHYYYCNHNNSLKFD